MKFDYKEGNRLKRLPLILIGILVLPWLSIPLLGKKSLKRYLFSALFLNVLIIGESAIAKKRVWWWYFRKFSSKITGETAIVWGPFFVASLWILKFTYGKFWRYLIVNTITDSFYTYVIMDWFKKIGFAALIRLKRYQLSILFVFKCLILYGLQFLAEKAKTALAAQSSEPTE